VVLTYRYRVKNPGGLAEKARAVNLVWNFCNETQQLAVRRGRRWISYFDFCRLVAGSSKDMGILSATILETCKVYERSRRQHKRPWLRWRGKKSLGWVPFRGQCIGRRAGGFCYSGKIYRLFESRPLPAGKIVDGGSFSQDASGNWYMNIHIEVADGVREMPERAVGIDLGLKDLATLSTGERVENGAHYRKSEYRLAQAQRGRKMRLAKRIQAKIANRRRDHLQKTSTRIVREFSHIYVGDVNASGLCKTNLAKSVHDAGWSTFRKMLAYKSIRDGAVFKEVSEQFSTQVCSGCGSIAGPKGQTDLNKRSWECIHCGAFHDRDVNAALNILRLGHQTPVQGIPAQAGGMSKISLQF
jgi:putative transposase